MKRLVLLALALTVLTVQPFAQTQGAQRSEDPKSPIRNMLDTYCVGCHSTTGHAGGVAFAGMSVAAIGDNAEVWEKAVRKVRGHLMPPPGSRQPSSSEVDTFVTTLESSLDSNAARPAAGHVGIQRLTRTEYGRPSRICSAWRSMPKVFCQPKTK
jgi:mono/diheme cytochrome c family protein